MALASLRSFSFCRSHLFPGCLLAALLLASACGQDTAAVMDAFAGPDTATPEVYGVFTNGDGKVAGGQDGPGDSVLGTGNLCEFAANPEPGQPGASCSTANDCLSTLCVEGATGKVCTRTCVDCCPSGFHCEQSGASDAQFICLPRLTALCRPCHEDGECAKVNAGALCIGYGESGRFCGGGCDQDSDCTAGYACQDAQGSVGAGKQCVRTIGECGCSARSVTDGASTTCAVVNGAGSCQGSRKCQPDGLTACNAPTPATETCNGADDDCDGAVDETDAIGCKSMYLDADSDGAGKAASVAQCLCKATDAYSATSAGDCDDANAAAHPGVTEACNGFDDDCNGGLDEGFVDSDQDGQADCVDADDDGDGTADDKDCAPLDAAISPTATEACNGVDDDCDGATDETGASGCKSWWTDADGDGDGKAGSVPECLCNPLGLFTAASAADCDDTAKDVHSGAAEGCNDLDDDCDAATDEGCDDDGDGWCDVALVVTGDPVVCPKGKKDCDDTSKVVHPGQSEVCDNGLDDDCDAATDTGVDASGCTVFFEDQDKDGFGVAKSQCLCAAQGMFVAGNAKDCNDGDPLVNPATQEVCSNGLDDNCNGLKDEEDAVGCTSYYQDKDGDGYGAGSALCLCWPSEKYTTAKSADCDDSTAKIGPAAFEACNGADDNCNGATDEQDAVGCTKYYVDGDLDGFGDAGKVACLCAPAGLFATPIAGDCDDTKAAANPGKGEECDGIDNDCDGTIDEVDAKGCTVFYADADADGYGDPNTNACLCVLVAPYKTAKGGDCDDKAAELHPGAVELCDGVDNDCDGAIDEQNSIGCFNFLRDEDGDGYGLAGVQKCLCKPTVPYSATQAGDCDDEKSAVNPKMAEVCDSIDNNCDGLADNAGADGCSPFFIDKDGDGFGTYFSAPKCLCNPAAPYVASAGGDCDDNDGSSYPKAQEVCDSKDNDCDGIIDQKGAKGCKTFYADGDGDGYGVSNLSQCTCSPDSYFTALQGGDCNDQTSTVNPGSKEVCNGIDDNCNGVIDDAAGATTYYTDSDSDGFGTGSGKSQCSAGGGFTVTKAGDCNDSAGNINPGASEIQCNGVDEDCNGADVCSCQPISEAFQSGANGWSIGSGWVIGAWAGHSGNGLGYGTGGNSYATSGSAASSSKTLAIPASATKLTFWYKYQPDPSEYGSYDAFSVVFGGQTLVSFTAGSKGSSAWKQVTFNLPQGWAGSSKVFLVSFKTLDSAYNNGFGAAVDDIQVSCN